MKAMYKQVAALHNNGLTRPEIMDNLEISLRQLNQYISVARRAGLIEPRKLKRMTRWDIYRHKGTRLGGIMNIITNLTDDERRWLFDEAAPMDDVASLLTMLVRDAAYEEQSASDDHAGEVEALKAKLAVATKALARANDLLKGRGIPMVERDA